MAKSKKSTNLDAIKHSDKRKNIPTHELRDFVREEENSPKTMLYPRDPSLDPQLVWKGKDEQDQQELSVPVVPIYIQEKILPQVIVEEVRKDAEKMPASREGICEEEAGYSLEQLNLFGDFNGLPKDFDQRVDFYKHDANWQNRMILGDSLMVMTSLAEKEGLKGKIQMIYIDPPYGIKFGSNWQVSTRKRDVKDGKAEDTTRQPEQIRAFRDTWKLGIHSYLAYLRDRLVLARELLTETGSCFVQIGDENVHLVRCLMDEVFGSENFCRIITFQKTGSIESNILGRTVDFILWYARNLEAIKYRQLYMERERGDTKLDRYDYVETPDGTFVRITAVAIRGEEAIPEGRRCRLTTLMSDGEAKENKPLQFKGKSFPIRHGKHWKTDPDTGGQKLAQANRIVQQGATLWYKRYVDDFPVVPLDDRWESLQIGTELMYVVQTASQVIERCMLMTTDPGDLVLDPTCGSGTTAFVAEEWGRRWITIDTSRVALALARTRLMSARYDSYHLADQFPEWTQFGADDAGLKNYLRKHPPSVEKEKADIRKGFVYKRVPHVTLKSIANNPDIKEGMTREQIDASIARHAETETLYDQPYEDTKSVRVAGPFTVESLSPHRVLPADENMDGNITPSEKQERGDFALMILENLKKSGVQNTKKNERLKFETLEPFAGLWIQAKGTYIVDSGELLVDSKSKTGHSPLATHHSRRVAVSIGPEHGTVGPGQIKEAAKEAVKGLGHDLLIVCGFAFDPHVSEEIKRYGSLTVLPTKMNPDLAMGDELLKKTGAGNLFMVFGEPDIDIIRLADNQIMMKLKGVDIYDPTTGVIRSNSTDDIACWFIDTDYNGESFFVRHAYFTGGQEPYDNLKRALRAEINEEAWSMLYSTESRPFDIPESGKIAVKVINHYGDEVLKVINIEESENPF